MVTERTFDIAGEKNSEEPTKGLVDTWFTVIEMRDSKMVSDDALKHAMRCLVALYGSTDAVIQQLKQRK